MVSVQPKDLRRDKLRKLLVVPQSSRVEKGVEREPSIKDRLVLVNKSGPVHKVEKCSIVTLTYCVGLVFKESM